MGKDQFAKGDPGGFDSVAHSDSLAALAKSPLPPPAPTAIKLRFFQGRLRFCPPYEIGGKLNVVKQGGDLQGGGPPCLAA